MLSRLLGRTITYREITFEENRDAMSRAGVASLLGRPGRTFEQFAADHATAFS